MTVHHSQDDDGPRLAEISRTLSDFRNEFRSAMLEVVRKDVYSAHMASIQLQLDMQAQESKRLAEQLERDRTDKATDRRAVRNAGLSATLSVGVAIIMLVIELVIK